LLRARKLAAGVECRGVECGRVHGRRVWRGIRQEAEREKRADEERRELHGWIGSRFVVVTVVVKSN
jgi:hypothetical protein